MSGNKTPQQQKAYQEQLQATVDAYDEEITFLQINLNAKLQQIQKYQALETSYPILSAGISLMIKWTQNNINQVQQQIQEYKQYLAMAIQEMKSVNPDFVPNQ